MGIESVVEGVEWNLSTEQLEAFRASGPHLLRRKYISIGRDEHQRFFVAELSAIVRVVSLDTGGSAEGARTASGRSNTPSLDFQRTTTAPVNRCEERSSHVDAATATKGFTLTSIEARSGSGSALEESEHGVRVPRAPPPQPNITSGRAHLDPGCTAASTDGRCYHQRPAAPAVYALDLTHLEVDALVGPNLAWKDPFKEDSDTIRDLEATSWAACLDSLCRRLRATAKAVDAGREGTLDGRPPVVGKQAFASDHTARSTGVDPLVGPSGPSDPSAISEERSQQRCLREELPVDTAVGGQGSPVPKTAKKIFSAVSLWDGDTVSLDESQNRQAVQALPLLRWRPARRKTGEDLFWLDKTILKVGARVPWGRLHRGRFAKMLFTVSLGKGCRGLDFVATSNSPTADPILRGCWECQATDRDLASRYLSPGRCGAVEGETRRRDRHDSYDPQRCAAELHERGELVWACAEIARKAFRLVMVVPGGVVLSLAGAPIAGGREVAWPQDVEEDRALMKASIELQRWWRGCISRKRTRWLRMEREGMRRLSLLREQAVVEKKKADLEAKAKLLLDEERRHRAQVVLATAARVRVARKEVSR
ncbi:unnamed protein product, partial [Ectocarpus sp. 12 AP-2014]